MTRGPLVRVARSESGWSLFEMLMAASLLLLVLGAALTPFLFLQRTDRTTQNQNESQDNARNVLDNISRQLRNTSGQNQLINLAAPDDLVLETVDASPKPSGSQNTRNIMRVRYCLDTVTPPATLTSGRIWEQDLRWTTAAVPNSMPSVSCPDTSWGTRRIVADFVTNKATSSTRPAAAPLFTYFPGSTDLDTITGVRIDVFSDRRFTEPPGETELATGVFLRNQNGSPTASFTATPGLALTKQITLNGGASSDPEKLPLTYRWCDVTSSATCDETTKVGSGTLYTYTAPAAGTRRILLQVFDIGGLEADAGPVSVTAP
jgi:hypothetical protein